MEKFFNGHGQTSLGNSAANPRQFLTTDWTDVHGCAEQKCEWVHRLPNHSAPANVILSRAKDPSGAENALGFFARLRLRNGLRRTVNSPPPLFCVFPCLFVAKLTSECPSTSPPSAPPT